MAKMASIARPCLAPGVRYRWDKLRGQHQLLYPEGILVLNDTGAAVVQLCAGRTTSELLAELKEQFPAGTLALDVPAFLDRLAKKGLLRDAADS